MIPLFFEPEIGEFGPLVQFIVSSHTTRCNFMFGILGFVGGENVREECKRHNDTDKQEFFEEEEDDAKEECNTEDGGVELAGAEFVRTGGSGPFKEDFLDFDIFGDFSGF